jgi:hypothetical protein
MCGLGVPIDDRLRFGNEHIKKSLCLFWLDFGLRCRLDTSEAVGARIVPPSAADSFGLRPLLA